MNPPTLPRLIHLPLRDFLSLALRTDDFVIISPELGLLINEVDKSNDLCHVEFPSLENDIKQPRLWNIKAWRTSCEKLAEARKISAQNKLEYDNYKWNVQAIANKIAAMSGQRNEDVLEVARAILRKNPEGVGMLGVILKHPYYRGDYIVLPFRNYYY